ncbi:MAG: hypothetical protein ACT6FD_07070 [Methanosarcinaceae archaeon]
MRRADRKRPGDCPAQRPGALGVGLLTERHTRKPESELAEKLSKVEKAFQNAVIKEIIADFGLGGVTKKRLSKYHRDNENWDKRMIGYRLKRALIAETYTAKHH